METTSFPESACMVPSVEDLHEMIRRRAEEIYFRSGSIPGRDSENWSQAEQEILREIQSPTPRRAIVVKVDGENYIGEYKTESSEGYVPGELEPGTKVAVRFEGGKMYVRRTNGKELETDIVKKTT